MTALTNNLALPFTGIFISLFVFLLGQWLFKKSKGFFRIFRNIRNFFQYHRKSLPMAASRSVSDPLAHPGEKTPLPGAGAPPAPSSRERSPHGR